jgi:hypothetical protein
VGVGQAGTLLDNLSNRLLKDIPTESEDKTEEYVWIHPEFTRCRANTTAEETLELEIP